MKNHSIRWLSLFWIVLCCSAQGEILSGTVKDPQGQPVPGVIINLYARVGGGGGFTTNSDSAGVYHFDGLPAGDYILRASAEGFADLLVDHLHLDPHAAQLRDLQLKLAGVREEVVVTASSTPQTPEEVSKAITTIDASEAEERNVLGLADAVDLAPGVRVPQLGGPGSLVTIRIRGMRDQDTAILIDGLRIRDASATQGDASALIEDLLFTDAQRIEVMSGSGSSLYGTDAIGGVVNVITDPGGGRTRGSLLLEGGSLGTGRARAQLAGGLKADSIQYSLGLSQVYVADGVNGDSPFRDTNAQGRITFPLAPWARLTVRLFAGNSFAKVGGEPDIIGNPAGNVTPAIPLPENLLRLYEQGVPLSSLNVGDATFIPAPDNPDATRAARFLDGALILSGQPAPSLDYSLSYQTLTTSRRYGDGPAGVGYQPDGSTRSLYDGRIQTVNAHLTYRLGSLQLLTGGYEFENENYANDNSDTSALASNSGTNVTQNSHSLFVQDQIRLFDGRLQLSGAFRAQYFNLSTPLFNPASSAPFQGISFQSPPPAYTGDGSAAYFFRRSRTKLRAHAGRGYRAPSLYERFGAGFDQVYGYTVYGDPLLKPERSIGIDAGIDQTLLHDRVKASASYFYTSLQNVIAFDTINTADPYGRYIGYVNTQGGLSRGAELSVAVSPVRSLSITSAYTFINAIERAPLYGTDLQTYVIPRNQFSILATERVTSRFMLTFDALASSNYIAPIYGSLTTLVYRFDGIHKVNLGASYRLPLAEYKAIRFFARIENLTGQHYFESGFPTPGRTAMGGIHYEF
jgi:vitamin B12 transporter